MHTRQLGDLWPVSALSLGGAGVAGAWGPVAREEALATVREAVDRGVRLLDFAPMYGLGEGERVVGEAFDGRLPDGVRVTTKCQLGTPPASEVYDRLRASLESSLERMRLDHVDLYFLHTMIVGDDEEIAFDPVYAPDGFGTPLSLYADAVRPAFERLAAEGLCGAWGITGIGIPSALFAALEGEPVPAAIQCIANLLDSPGSSHTYGEDPQPRELMAAARTRRAGVMGIRAVQGGVLTEAFDPTGRTDRDRRDHERAEPFRAIARELEVSSAYLAHRYALSMEGVDTVVLGVKNRVELRECLQAEADGPLDGELTTLIDRAVGRR